MARNVGEDERIVEGPGLPPTLALKDINIGQFLDQQAEKHAANLAIVSTWQDVRLTYEDLHNSCKSVAKRLLERGVRPRDHVVVLAGNSVEYVQLFFAVSAIGAVFCIINPTFAADEVLAAVDFLDPKAIFVADRIGYRKNNALLAELVKQRGLTTSFVQLGTGKVTENVPAWQDFLETTQGDVNGIDLLAQHWATCLPDDAVCIQFTSGTTGPRKGAMITHANLLSNAVLVGNRLEYTSADVVCSTTPLFHCFALGCGLLSTVAYGGTVVLPSDVFLAGATLQALSKFKCTVIHSVATMLQAIMDHPEANIHRPSIVLRTGIIGGSALTRELLTRLSAEFGYHGVAYGYGMTEATCIVFMTDPREVSLLDDFSSVGTLLPSLSAKVVDADLKALPAGTPGELLVAGHCVFQEYYKNPSKTEEAVVRDAQGRRWLRTGDLVTIDEAGRCTMIGRVKDMIKRGGENIFPRDVEEVLEQHPDVHAAAVVGIPDPYWGETVGAFIQRAKGLETSSGSTESQAHVGSKELKLWMRSRVAPHKMPEHFFWIGEGKGVPDDLPVNYTGKVVKSELRAAAIVLVKG
ncbi:AMP-binding enzyme [Seiridium cupressi]